MAREPEGLGSMGSQSQTGRRDSHTHRLLYTNFFILNIYGLPTVKDEGLVLSRSFTPPHVNILFVYYPTSY